MFVSLKIGRLAQLPRSAHPSYLVITAGLSMGFLDHRNNGQLEEKAMAEGSQVVFYSLMDVCKKECLIYSFLHLEEMSL